MNVMGDKAPGSWFLVPGSSFLRLAQITTFVPCPGPVVDQSKSDGVAESRSSDGLKKIRSELPARRLLEVQHLGFESS